MLGFIIMNLGQSLSTVLHTFCGTIASPGINWGLTVPYDIWENAFWETIFYFWEIKSLD